jgi:surfeit locus 1 family protein
MPNPSKSPKSGFPVGLTVTVALAVAILVGLGVWQLERLKWKTALLAHIAALQHAPPQPLAAVLARAAVGEDVNLTRVTVDCLQPAFPASRVFLRGVGEGGAFTWRPVSACRIAAHGYGLIAIDRGVATAGGMEGPPGAPAPPVRIVGVIREPEEPTGIQSAIRYSEGEGQGYQFRSHAVAALLRQTGGTAPKLMIVSERETPAPAGVTPAPLPVALPNNHLQYAFTWFGLAAALIGVYAAMLSRRFKAA